MKQYHSYTELEDELIKQGIKPETLTQKEYQYRKQKLRIVGKGGQKPVDWSPAMDLAIIDPITGKFPKNWRNNPIIAHVKTSTCKVRHSFLRVDYFDTGWGSLIGTQKIYPCDCGDDKEII